MLLFCRTTNTTTHQQGWRVTHRPVTGVLPKVRFALIFLLTLTAPTLPLSDALLQLQCCFWVTNGIREGNSCRNSLLKSKQGVCSCGKAHSCVELHHFWWCLRKLSASFSNLLKPVEWVERFTIFSKLRKTEAGLWIYLFVQKTNGEIVAHKVSVYRHFFVPMTMFVCRCDIYVVSFFSWG